MNEEKFEKKLKFIPIGFYVIVFFIILSIGYKLFSTEKKTYIPKVNNIITLSNNYDPDTYIESTIICADGYKFIIAKSLGANGISITQMYKKSNKPSDLAQPIQCNN